MKRRIAHPLPPHDLGSATEIVSKTKGLQDNSESLIALCGQRREMRAQGSVLGPRLFLHGLAFIGRAVAFEGVPQAMQPGKWFHYRPSLISAPTLGFEIVLK